MEMILFTKYLIGELQDAVRQGRHIEMRLEGSEDWIEVEPISIDIGLFSVTYFHYKRRETGNGARVTSHNVLLTKIAGFRKLGSEYSFNKQ